MAEFEKGLQAGHFISAYPEIAFGKPLDNFRLWKFEDDGTWSTENQISQVTGVTPILHQKAMEKIEEGFRNLSSKYPNPDNGSHPRISAGLWI